MTEKQNEKRSPLNRQQFLGIAWLASLAALVGEFVAATFKFVEPNLDMGFGGKILAGRVEEFLPGSVNLVQSGRFFLVRREDSGFIAFWQRCTHLGCSVPYDDENQNFHCPCHGSIFDEEKGEVVGGPAPRPMDIFPIEIIDGEVRVDTGSPIKRRSFSDEQIVYA